METKTLLRILISGIVILGSLWAAEPAVPNSIIQGTVLDSTEQAPLEYANVTIYEQNKNEHLAGTVTDNNGFFILEDIPAGTYFVKINYMGYKTDTISVNISPEYSKITLGEIFLPPKYLELSGVEATAENISMDYQIDKKVLNVNRQQSSISGSAVQILENAPSITTDIEGNVELRGSSNFRVLINGKPTIQNANDVLQQTPASTIDKIEIITNPSAKYNPEGSAGIINLVLKRNRLQGINGMATANGGSFGRFGGEILLNKNNDKFNTSLSLDYNERPSPGQSWEKNETTNGDTTSFIYSDGDREWAGRHYGLRGELEYLPDTVNTLKLSLRAGRRRGQHESDNLLRTWSTNSGNRITDIDTTDNFSRGEYGGQFYSLNLNYDRKLPGRGHKITGNLDISFRNFASEHVDKQFNSTGEIATGTKSSEDGPGNRMEFKIDYVLPLAKESKFEAGLQNRRGHREETNENFTYNRKQNTFVHDIYSDNDVEYNRNIGAAYSIYSGKLKKFGYQAGLRGEYTYRKISLLDSAYSANINRWDMFPTLHFSYQLAEKQELMLSYTRRIDRPRGWYLEPFETRSDPYTIRSGNPDLTPEYINSYELGYKLEFERSFISLESYYRQTIDKIERVRSVHPDYTKVFLHTFDNVGQDHSIGSEIMFNLNLYKWWNINLAGNFYDYRVEGELNGRDFSQHSFNWTTRFNNTFNLNRKTRLQINNYYNSPSVSSQGRREGFFVTSASIRRDFMDHKLTAILQARDIFDTAEWKFKSEGQDFYMERHFDRNAPMFTITLRYNINQYKNGRRRGQRNGGDDFEGGIEGGEF